MPKISVIVPVYKVEKYIHRCVDSILSQTFTDYELVLVDDGSPDNCGKICDEYALKGNHIHVIHKVNGGLSDARNAGIDWVFEHNHSEWITFIDSDDWIHPEYLSYLYRAVCDYNVSVSVCSFIKDKEIATYSYEHFNGRLVAPESLMVQNRENTIVAWGKLYKKQLFQNLRYPVGKLHEDEFVTYKLLFENNRLYFLDNPLYYYFLNPTSITQSNWNVHRLDRLTAFYEQMKYFKKNCLKAAYASTARVLYLGYADAIKMLREHSGISLLSRFKYLMLYYLCKLRFYDRFLTVNDKVIVKNNIHPLTMKFKKWITKKKRNFVERIKGRNSFG